MAAARLRRESERSAVITFLFQRSEGGPRLFGSEANTFCSGRKKHGAVYSFYAARLLEGPPVRGVTSCFSNSRVLLISASDRAAMVSDGALLMVKG